MTSSQRGNPDPGQARSGSWRSQLQPAWFLALWFIGILAVLGLWRIILMLWAHDRLDGVGQAVEVFLHGLRMDSVLAGYLSAIPALVMWFAPPHRLRDVFMRCYGCGILMTLTFLELATFDFMTEFDRRPDRLFIEYLDHPREVLSTVLVDHWPMLILASILLSGAAIGSWKLSRRIMSVFQAHSAWPVRIAGFLVTGALIFLAARGTLGNRPVNISTAAFSNNNIANQLTLNSTYSVLYAAFSMRHESDPAAVYGYRDEADLITRVLSYAHIDPASMTGNPGSPLEHHIAGDPAFATGRPRNLVVILEESMGAEYVGCLGGLPLTPNLDRLSEEGMMLTKLYATGTRSVRGLEAISAAFLPTPGRSILKLPGSQSGFFTFADLLGQHSYHSSFIYGGEANFDNMLSFFRGNGFETVIEQKDFANPRFVGTWGVSDEELMERAHALFTSYGDEPFCSLIFSTSNHTPFEFPENSIELYEEPAATVNNAIKYADHAIGRFFELARDSDYYANTVFVILADHNTRTKGPGIIPVEKFHIPGLIIAPGLEPGRFERVCSQIDLLPTVLPLLGFNDLLAPTIGFDLRHLDPAFPGRAILQFGTTNGFLEGDDLVIHMPNAKPREFRWLGDHEEPVDPNPEHIATAHAHALLPGWLYHKRAYPTPTLNKPGQSLAH